MVMKRLQHFANYIGPKPSILVPPALVGIYSIATHPNKLRPGSESCATLVGILCIGPDIRPRVICATRIRPCATVVVAMHVCEQAQTGPAKRGVHSHRTARENTHVGEVRGAH